MGFDLYQIENWNVESVAILREFDIEDDESILRLLFHQTLPSKLLKWSV